MRRIQALKSRFRGPVRVASFGGTRRAHRQEHEGVIFFNPGSPTLPSDRRGDDDLGSVAVLEVRDGEPHVELIRLSR